MLIEFLSQAGATAIALGIAAYLSRTWLTHQFDKIENKYAHDLAIQLESVRADLAKEIARINVRENYLHKRRVEVIESIFEKMIEAEFSLQNFLVSWWGRTNRDEIKRKFPSLDLSGSFDLMESRGGEFCKGYTEINAELHRNALYFEESFMEAIGRAYSPIFDEIIALDYENPPDLPERYKDIVNAGKAPRLAVINEFRKLLGVF